MTIREAAALWNLSERRVNELCRTGRIPGAYKEGRQWIIPDKARKPADKRRKRGDFSVGTQLMRRPLPIGVSDFRDACAQIRCIGRTFRWATTPLPSAPVPGQRWT